MRDLVILGAGGHGRETLDIVEAINAEAATFNFLGFIDDDPADGELLRRRNVCVIGDTAHAKTIGADYVIGIGSSNARARLDNEMSEAGHDAAVLVHPAASVASDNQLLPGVVVATGAVVTTNVRLGRHTHLNVGAIVSHDCRIGDHVTLSPAVRLNGNVTVHDRAFFGTGAIVTPGITIGEGAIVGAGAVVIHDVAAGATVVGVPAQETDAS